VCIIETWKGVRSRVGAPQGQFIGLDASFMSDSAVLLHCGMHIGLGAVPALCLRIPPAILAQPRFRCGSRPVAILALHIHDSIQDANTNW